MKKMIPFDRQDYFNHPDAKPFQDGTPAMICSYGPLTLIYHLTGIYATLENEEATQYHLYSMDGTYCADVLEAIKQWAKGKTKKQLRDYFMYDLGLEVIQH